VLWTWVALMIFALFQYIKISDCLGFYCLICFFNISVQCKELFIRVFKVSFHSGDKGQNTKRMSLEQGNEDAARAGAALLWSQAERAGLGQPGQEKGRPESSSSA
uniref:Uncharacterized protein n=1 Tax=Melopsittacus undulatus TaxID=13146 RepID=A0A8V5GWY8_MELUD